jgi:hypothetical protein
LWDNAFEEAMEVAAFGDCYHLGLELPYLRANTCRLDCRFGMLWRHGGVDFNIFQAVPLCDSTPLDRIVKSYGLQVHLAQTWQNSGVFGSVAQTMPKNE